nr:integrase, catalytic region, zinc finger, CCHC-type, peptidase aspartic, catalytic [Tanacetum cinerariifolium]
DTVSSSESAPTFAELFETNELKAQIQEKDTMILKLKEKIKSSSGDVKERKPRSSEVKIHIIKLSMSNHCLGRFHYNQDYPPQEVVKQSRMSRYYPSKDKENTIGRRSQVRDLDSGEKVVQIVLWYLDSGCSKHMTGDRSQLINFVQKFLGTVKFGNDHVAKIMGYGDYQIGNVTIFQCNVVPPATADLYHSPKNDLSWTGLLEFADDTVTDYSRPSPTVESTSAEGQNKISTTAENGESTDSILSKPAVKFVKAGDKPAERPTTDKVETAKKPAVRYAEMYRRTSKRSTVGGTKETRII